ncbi:hypothetical protein GUJ93_ZPchr0013g37638 [Zizania palustris]|uniref:Uncharacterized protein n=1 Tax=Zizania palustris TaxID=103762 RepID=A0A8J5X079_ZIZPA|nr:hypothetical protein GUJ93_ZPchr0013g37638 [Zizania palustris]
MGIINWMQNRLNAKQEKRRAAAAAAVVSSTRCRGESWRQEAREEKVAAADYGFLSIGTLGNESPAPGAPPLVAASGHDVPDFPVEEVKKLQEALNKLLRRAKSKSSGRGSSTADQLPPLAAEDDERAGSNLPLDRFLNCPSSLEVDRRISLGRHATAADGGGQNGEFSPDTHILLSKARDLLVTTTNTNNHGDINQKSFKFLLKNIFVCRGGFAPAPSLKDPVESRMDKLFIRTMLHKKMNPRPNNATSSRRYHQLDLEDKPSWGKIMQREHIHDEEDENGEDIFKWDKTDSDFIVLEM